MSCESSTSTADALALALFLDDFDEIECALLASTAAPPSSTLSIASSGANSACSTAPPPLRSAAPANVHPSTHARLRAPRKHKRVRARTPSGNTHAKRQKAEIAALRSSAETMELQLALMLQQHERRLAHTRSAAKHPHVTREDRTTDTAQLKDRAQHEMLARHTAVETHAKLRKLAAEAHTMARKMEQTLARYPSPSQLLADLTAATPALQVRPSGDTLVYRQLERRLHARTRGASQLRVQELARTDGLDAKPLGFEVHDTPDASAVLMRNSRVMPFSTELICNLMWRDERFEEIQTKDSMFTVVERFDSTLFLEKRYTIRQPGLREDVTVVFHSVLTRSVDQQQRMVLAWESVGEWPDVDTVSAVDAHALGTRGLDSPASITVREHGWGLVQPARVHRAGADASATRPTPASILSMSTVLAPDAEPSGGSAPATHRARLRSDAVIPTYQVAFAARMQVLENMLLDHSIAAQSRA